MSARARRVAGSGARAAAALVVGLGALASLALRPRVARAQGNYHAYPLGERALGLGGAYTALGDEATGAWYNPAGAVFSANSTGSITVSTSLYGLVFGRFPQSLGRGLDYEYAAINVVPSAVGGVLRLGTPRADGSARFAISLAMYAPNSTQLERRVDLRAGRTVLLLSHSDRTLVPTATFSWRVSDRVALGASVASDVHLLYDRVDLSDRPGPGLPDHADRLFQFLSTLDASGFGVFAAFGARVELGRGFTLGVAARTPSVQVFGDSQWFERTVRVEPEGASSVRVRSGALDARRLHPGRFSAGVSYTLRDRVTLSADLVAHTPLRYRTVQLGGGPVAVRDLVLSAVVNGAVGVEWVAHPRIALRAGLFTDFSAAPPPTGEGSRIDQVHQGGATVTGTLRTGISTTTAGVLVTYGVARVLGVDVASESYAPFTAEGTIWRLFFVLSGSAGP